MPRVSRARIGHPAYLSKSNYEIWLGGLERLVAERGLVSEEEIAVGRSLGPGRPVARILAAADVANSLGRGAPTNRDAPHERCFSSAIGCE